jgi:tRNA dimethylallyltransferase
MSAAPQRQLPKQTTEVTMILGPTASGKSNWIRPLLERGRFFFLGCDSVHLYQELQVGSTRPRVEELRNVYHSAIASHSIDERVNAAEYAQTAVEATHAARMHHLPLLVSGGSPFYFLAVAEGLAPARVRDLELRHHLESEYRESPASLYEEMVTLDPELRERIHRNDQYRIVRALEVMRLTGQKWSDLQNDRQGLVSWKEGNLIILQWEPELLRKRISERTRAMLDDGLVDEVRQLCERGFTLDVPGLMTVGYRQVGEYLRGAIKSEDELRTAIETATWHLARKQMTFFRSFSKRFNVHWIDGAWAATPEGQSALVEYWERHR